MPDTNPEHRISELARRAGVTVRTVRYYLAEGLLPPPFQAGRYARYGETHLLRLMCILKLKEAFLPLDEIKLRLDKMDDDQVDALLNSWDVPEKPETQSPSGGSEPPDDAAAYLSRIRASRIDLDRTIESSAPAVRGIHYSLDESIAFPEDRRDRVGGEKHRDKSVPPDRPNEEDALSLEEPTIDYSRILSFQSLPLVYHESAGPLAEPDNPSSDWKRITLVKGVELHVENDMWNSRKSIFEKLAHIMRQLISDSLKR